MTYKAESISAQFFDGFLLDENMAGPIREIDIVFVLPAEIEVAGINRKAKGPEASYDGEFAFDGAQSYFGRCSSGQRRATRAQACAQLTEEKTHTADWGTNF